MAVRVVVIALTLAGLGAITFCYWGLETTAGRKAFDEMDGLIPFFAGVGGLGLWGLALVILAINLWIQKQKRQ